MSQLMITEDQQRFLNESSEPVEIVDRTGRVLTRVVHGFSQCELDEAVRSRETFVPVGTLREAIDTLKSMSARASTR